VEDRTGKDTGLRNLLFHDLAPNQIWVAIAALAADLLAWTARLALPAHAATYELQRFWLRILAVAARIVRTARRHKIDPAWPWAEAITTAYIRLTAPGTPDQGPGAPATTAEPETTPAHHNNRPQPTSTTRPKDLITIMMKNR
jgi:Transposase DDE domain group 1